jgi:hypothetical protein
MRSQVNEAFKATSTQKCWRIKFCDEKTGGSSEPSMRRPSCPFFILNTQGLRSLHQSDYIPLSQVQAVNVILDGSRYSSQWPVIAYLAPRCLMSIALLQHLYLLLHPGARKAITRFLPRFFWVPGVFSRDENIHRQKSWKYHLAMLFKAF